MNYDIRCESWIPWRRRSGAMAWGPPSVLTDRVHDDPIVALAAPRPDFDAAVQEFLIGLLGIALWPEDDAAWEALWHAPPTPEALQAAFDALPPAFDLDGDGPRFFQDFPTADLAAEPAGTIDQMLIDAVGDQGIRLNKDLFVKRARVERLSRPAAAMALITLQTYAPAGGRGNRTSLRGGGPLTTLVDPRVDARGEPLAHERPLWEKLWANVDTVQQVAKRSPGAPTGAVDVFPWLAPTRGSAATGANVTTANASPWQAYFGLPRRVRLEFGGPGRCDLTGEHDEVTVVAFRSRPYGVQYTNWQHPLTPHYLSATKEWFPMHGQPGGIGWRDWLGLALGTPDEKRQPAETVARFAARGRRVGVREARLHAVGYDMDNAKARGWTDATQPVFVLGDDAEHRAIVADVAARLTEGASLTASLLLGAVERGLFQRAEDAPGDLSAVKGELWAATEAGFFRAMRTVAVPGASAATGDDVSRDFARTLAAQATAIFDRWCPGDASLPATMRRVVTARYNLTRALGGWTPLGEKLFETLRVPLPGGGRAVRTAKSRVRKEATK